MTGLYPGSREDTGPAALRRLHHTPKHTHTNAHKGLFPQHNNTTNSMSRPRPVHQPPRELRSQPDDSEPSLSYERESFLGGKEVDFEDDFHRRVSQSKRSSEGGGGGVSFWRSNTTGENPGGPSFSSMSMKPSGAPLRHSGSLLTPQPERKSLNASASTAGSLSFQDSGEFGSGSVSRLQRHGHINSFCGHPTWMVALSATTTTDFCLTL